MAIDSITKRSDFMKIGKNNTSFCAKTTLILASPTLKTDFDKETLEFIRVGYTVTKKIGNAVFRNKCKRRYREIIRELAPDLCKNHHDYIILARTKIQKANFNCIKNDVKFCLNGINKLLNKNG